MAIDVQAMHQILGNVFDNMLGLPSTPIETPSTLAANVRVVALICIFGRTKESLVVEAPAETACVIASTMFDTAPESIDEDDVRDAIGEVANMICGNMKGTYEGESRLSMPYVSLETGPLVISDLNHTWIQVAGHPLLVRWQNLSAVAV